MGFARHFFLKMKDYIIFILAAAMFFACKQNAPANSAATGFANETDNICGMKVQASYTDTCHYKGKVYAFCSESCKEKFITNPEYFLNKEK